ncbi:LPXTG cell wall anchor domain-containing protein, partial [Mammaliicoccus stepanovicii]
NPLKPVDPEDPTKGYVPPSITNPNNPSEDTPNKPDIPSKLKTPDMQEKKDKSKTQVKEKRVQQLPDTGETNNTGLLSAMLGLLGGIIFSTSRKKYQKEDQQ